MLTFEVGSSAEDPATAPANEVAASARRKNLVALGVCLVVTAFAGIIVKVVAFSGGDEGAGGVPDTCEPAGLDAEIKAQLAHLAASIDPETAPCEDFYRHACGAWLDRTHVSGKQFVSKMQSDVTDTVNAQLERVLEDGDAAAARAKKAGNKHGAGVVRLLELCQDTDRLDSNSDATLQKILSVPAIAEVLDEGKLTTDAVIELHKLGVDILFSTYLGGDGKISFVPAGLEPVQAVYEGDRWKTYLELLFTAAGEEDAAGQAAAVNSLEFGLRKKIRDDDGGTVKLTTWRKVVEDIKLAVGDGVFFDFDEYAGAFDFPATSTSTFRQSITFFYKFYWQDVSRALSKAAPELIRSYVKARIFHSYARLLGKSFRTAAARAAIPDANILPVSMLSIAGTRWQPSRVFQAVDEVVLGSLRGVHHAHGEKATRPQEPPLSGAVGELSARGSRSAHAARRLEEENEDQERFCLDQAKHLFDFPLLQIYADHVPSTAALSERARAMLVELSATFYERLDRLGWVDEKTAQAAMDKGREMKYAVGASQWLRDAGQLAALNQYVYGDALEEMASHHGELLEVLPKMNVALNEAKAANIGKRRPAGSYADEASGFSIEAQYTATMNLIDIPFVNVVVPMMATAQSKTCAVKRAVSALSLGGLGTVLGHEITHAFDAYGAQFDGDGREADWWYPETKQEFNKRSQCLVEEFNRIPMSGSGAEAVLIDGEQTLDENIADLGGVSLAYETFVKRLGGEDKAAEVLFEHGGKRYTGSQLFFLRWGQTMCMKFASEQQLVRAYRWDAHAPHFARINGHVNDLPGLLQAFQCPQPEGEKCEVW